MHSDRIRLARWLVGAVLVAGAALRVVLYSVFHDGGFQVGSLALALAAGLLHDFLAALVVLAPLLLALAALRLRILARAPARTVFLALVFALIVFDAVAEFLYFSEFDARFNHIAVDYLLYPTEVFTNIGQSYDVPLVVAVSLVAGVGAALFASRRLAGVEFGPLPLAARARGASLVLAAAGLSFLGYARLPAALVESRVTNEIAQNGWAQLLRAFLTSDLDYRAYYATLPSAEARARAARALGFPAPTPEEAASQEGEFRLAKLFGPAADAPEGDASGRNAADRPLDAVVVLEESLGSSFVGVLGGDGSTPEFDRWSEQGLLLTRLVATGNRTVRGLEGVLCSFPPLPGDSVVKRTRRPEVACLARVFENRGYATCFLYGGYGIFDHMKPFMTKNGFAEFVEQGDYPEDAFTTAWGVADEYIFDALFERQVRAERERRPLFATMLSVSNHRPYSVPPGRTDRPPGEQSRTGAVRYADHCLGRYLDRARDAGLLEHTVVLVVGDHGARVYGSEEIPVKSYRIPGLFLAPDPALRGRKLDRMASQIDLAPTLLALAGAPCAAPFFGTDLLRAPEGTGRAFVHHDRDVGLLTDDTLVVLGLKKTTHVYARRPGAVDEFEHVPDGARTPAQEELVRDTVAVFQTADELYRAGGFELARAVPPDPLVKAGPSR